MSDLKELSQRQVSLERMDPLNSNRLVTFVNHFIVSIVQQLNELSSVVDSRLFDLNHQIQRCNANLVILEVKLNSIPGLSSASAAPLVVTNAYEDNNEIQVNSNSVPEMTAKSDTNCTEDNERPEDTKSDTKSDSNEEPNEEIESKDREEEPIDPRITKYKKMFSLGIPLDAVHQKMRLEGVDPSLLKG